jgi:hypothetical protein
MGRPTTTMRSATRIMRTTGFMPPPVSAAVCADKAEEEPADAAGFSTVQFASHWETGVPLSEPASHSSPPSMRPFPQEATDTDESDDEEISSSEDSDDDVSDDETPSLPSEDDASDELSTDAREKKRMELWSDDEDMLKIQSGRMNGALERCEDEPAEVVGIDAPAKELVTPMGMYDEADDADGFMNG